ncbi:MAG TPA: ABC transporter ATP-binding protein [Candidatus Margulisbacteria bacterium]|nr:MAG: ABC transporter [Candidatus Margulisbacteria bacterium GWD2_39_127]OGI02399.1 MAG: ABC transporter [Candidatus Margulisbacteria bacterium GWF2_38_17]OGI08531.1 MAG: ABC transporter [Candidatus Margulisbacteria bacterium GWE2_39_32]HAR63442.1 ABC transporter ATP-binding protein [Candidatus Margulisiibacteriota bacterium]HCT85600.1 ABC transporter ATP-binding protein [Candidatus Margulisiibacteriota bacterium]
MKPLIVDRLKKSYGMKHAVKDISFEVNKQEIFGLIGPDGAGKTTIMRIIVTLLKMDTGSVLFQSKNITDNIRYVRSNIGYMPQRFSLYQDLTVEQNLNFFGDLFGVPKDLQDKRKERLYGFSRLEPFRGRRAGALSGGMKQKLALSCMLMHEPEVIILDEPTFGVDPLSRNELWQILHELSEKGITILISTPYMEEAAECSKIGLIYEGEMLGINTPQEFVDNFTLPLYLLKTQAPHQTFKRLQQTEYMDSIQLFGEGVHLVDEYNLGLSRIQDQLSEYHIDDIVPIQPKLEDVFLNLLSKQRV